MLWMVFWFLPCLCLRVHFSHSLRHMVYHRWFWFLCNTCQGYIFDLRESFWLIFFCRVKIQWVKLHYSFWVLQSFLIFSNRLILLIQVFYHLLMLIMQFVRWLFDLLILQLIYILAYYIYFLLVLLILFSIYNLLHRQFFFFLVIVFLKIKMSSFIL